MNFLYWIYAYIPKMHARTRREHTPTHVHTHTQFSLTELLTWSGLTPAPQSPRHKAQETVQSSQRCDRQWQPGAGLSGTNRHPSTAVRPGGRESAHSLLPSGPKPLSFHKTEKNSIS